MKKRTQKKFILTGYRAKGINLYTPQRNKVKLLSLIGFVVLCLVTPCTNFLLLAVGKVLNKYPLWLYK